MQVLIISSNRVDASPSGPAYVAGAALAAGHTVEVFDCFFARDLPSELEDKIGRFQPDVIGISIRFVNKVLANVNPAHAPGRQDLRIGVKQVVDCVKGLSSAPIVLGGPGFNYFGRNWLEYLDLDYGIRGESELSFPLYLKRLDEGGDIHTVPGCIFREKGRVGQVPRELVEDLDATAFPAYELFDLDGYLDFGMSPAILTKRGCAFGCIHCPYSSLEGTRYRLKSPWRVVDEIERIQKARGISTFNFCDNLFNSPRDHAEAICRELIQRGIDIEWSTGLTPLGVTDDFCRLLKDAACTISHLDVEFGSAKMLKRMRRGYGPEHIREAMISLDRAGLPFTLSLLLGGPGETPETISETFELVDSLPQPRSMWVTVGLELWTHHQSVVAEARREGHFEDDYGLFEGAYYLSPELPREYLAELVDYLEARDNCTYQLSWGLKTR